MGSKFTGVKYRSAEGFRFKRLLKELSSKEGRHTELVTLLIPPNRQLTEVVGKLREEYATASNIKSRATRHNVEDALSKVMQRVKMFDETPPTGLAVLCGAIPYGSPGNEEIEIHVIIPPEPIPTYLYRCDSRFHLEPLLDMVGRADTIGILVLDGSGATFATLKGRSLEVVKSITSGISSKHRAGGQSARRFERLREAEINEYFKRVAQYANQIFLNIPDLRKIIVGGPGPKKHDFLDDYYLHYALKDKISAIVNTAYIEEQGVKEVVAKAPEILKGVRYVEERNLVQQLLYEVGHDTGLATYGEDHVRRSLTEGLAKTILLSEDIQTTRISIQCPNCNYSRHSSVKNSELPRLEPNLARNSCQKCGSTLSITDRKDLIDDLAELAEHANAEVELISSAHEEGEMLHKSFGGVAAILRYTVDGRVGGKNGRM